MKTKKELENNLIIAQEMLDDIKREFSEQNSGAGSDSIYLYHNTRLVNRCRIVLNTKLKELEQYK
jgi:hypothetical protein